MRYLVTGASGFLGGHLARVLAARGHEVVPFSRSAGGDILDPRSVRAAAAGCDGAFHCAGRVSRRPEDAAALYRLHVEGTKSVLSACAEARVKRVVLASSSGTVAVSREPNGARTEESPAPLELLARWPYYRSKLFAERAALERNAPDFEVVSVNPSLLLGPGDLRGSSTEDVRRFLEGSIFVVPDGGLSFVDVRDAAEAMALAMVRGRAGERYLVTACNLTVHEFFARIGRVAGRSSPWRLPMPRSGGLGRLAARWVEGLAAWGGAESAIDAASLEMAQLFWYADASKAERELGWRARDPNVTLRDTVADLRERGVVWPEPRAADATTDAGLST